MKNLKQFINETETFKFKITKAQHDEISFNMESADNPQDLGKLNKTFWAGDKASAHKLGQRLKFDYDPSYGFEGLSKKLGSSLHKLGLKMLAV
jgi:hypothetical protein